MSQLQKAIERVQRKEGPRLGFGPVAREKPRALLAAVIAASAGDVGAAVEGKADIVFVSAAGSSEFVAFMEDLDCGDVVVGAISPGLEVDEAVALREASCDFVVSPLAATAAAAIHQEEMGHVISVPLDVSDTTLRSLGPLGLNALFVDLDAPTLTLGSQLELVRLASFASTPLFVTGSPGMEVDELRVLRDSGVAGVVLPAGASAADLESLGGKLRAIPPRRPSGRGSSDMALVPSLGVPAESDVETEPIEDGPA